MPRRFPKGFPIALKPSGSLLLLPLRGGQPAACIQSASESAPKRAAATAPLRVQGQTGTAPARLRTKAPLSDGGPGPTLPQCALGGPGRLLLLFAETKSRASLSQKYGRGRSTTFPTLLHLLQGFRTCGCDQRAFRSPFGNLRAHPFLEFYGGKKSTTFPTILFSSRDFASADATKGLSGRPLETFGGILLDVYDT